MYKIIAIRLNNEIYQCELTDEKLDELEWELHRLNKDDDVYPLIVNSLEQSERTTFEEIVSKKAIYYRLKPIQYGFVYHDVFVEQLPETAKPFMQNGKPAENAEQVFENLYYFSEQKEALVKRVNLGQIFYSDFSYVCDELPLNAQPLFEFSHSESARMKTECKRFRSSLDIFLERSYRITYALLEASYLIFTYMKEHPEMVVNFFLLSSVAYAAAHNVNQINKNSPALNLDSDTNSEPANLLEKNEPQLPSLTPSNTPINFVLNKPVLEENEARNNQFPVFNNPSQLEKYFLKAIAGNNLNNFKHAIKQGYDIKKKNKDGKYSLISAARHNSSDIIYYVAKELAIDLNFFQKSGARQTNDLNLDWGDSWILAAIERENYKLARNLVEWGVNINYLFRDQDSLLHVLSFTKTDEIDQRDVLTYIKKLVSLGANINLYNKHGLSPVFFAALDNKLALVKYFLDKKCQTTLNNLKPNLLATCLRATTTTPETIKFLLQYGLDPYTNVNEYLSGERIPAYNIPLVAAVLRGDTSIIDLLIKYDVGFDRFPGLYSDLLFSAFRNMDSKMAYYLVKRGVQVEHFEAIWKIMAKTDVSKYAPIIHSFFKTLGEWRLYASKFTIEDRHRIRTCFNFDANVLEIPEFVIFYKSYLEIELACKEDDYTRFKNALDGLKPIPKLNDFITSIEESEDSDIPDFLMDAFAGHTRVLHFIHFFLKWVPSDAWKALFLCVVLFAFNRFLLKNLNQTNVGKNVVDEEPILPKPTLVKPHSNNRKNIKKEMINREFCDISKLSAEHLLNITHQKKLLNSCIERCRTAKNNLVKKDEFLIIHNELNYWLTHHRQVELESGFRPLQLNLNGEILELHRVAKLLQEQILNTVLFNQQAERLLDACQTELDNQYAHYATDTSEPEFREIIFYDEAVFTLKIESVEQNRNDINKLKKFINDSIEKIALIESQIKKLKIDSPPHEKKVVIPRTPSVENNHVNVVIVKGDVAVKSEKKKPVPSNSHVKQELKEKKTSPRKTYYFFPACNESEEIKKDPRVKYLNELFCTIENVIKNDEWELEFRQDAAVYLISKTSLMLRLLLVEYQTILVHPRNSLQHLRNNMVHHLEDFFRHSGENNTDILKYLGEFFNTFNALVLGLKKEGAYKEGDKRLIVHTDTLQALCPLILTKYCQDDNVQSTGDCLHAIKLLLAKSERYYKTASSLVDEHKYEHAGILHSGMHAVVLQFREKMNQLKDLNFSLFNKINRLLPNIIPLGNIVAHKLSDKDDLTLTATEREYYAQEDIPPFSLWDKIKQIEFAQERILVICNKFNTESACRTLSTMHL